MIVYRATHISTGRHYIGLTTHSLDDRIQEHLNDAKNGDNSKFHKALREFGEHAFQWDVLHQNVPDDFIQQLERIEISVHDSNIRGFNGTKGGELNGS